MSELINDEIVVAEMNRRDWRIRIGEEDYKISTAGIFNHTTEIIDSKGETIIKVEARKWYSNEYVVLFENTAYRLITRNNPLIEWVIKKEEDEYLAYGLDTMRENKKPAVRITEKDNAQPLLFHALLWYLFEPVAMENTVDFQWWILGI